ncbi:MAG: ATP-binding protein [Solobacterium sp.]|nr:ATP-binding protein [Solobacterium sp.]
MKLNYTITNESYTQEELSSNIVDAKYSSAIIPGDEGNACIEALPRISFDKKDVITRYTNALPLYTNKETTENREKRKMLVQQMELIRVPLPFVTRLDYLFYRALLSSYRARDFKIVTSKRKSLRLYGEICDAAVPGFALIGESGCGKSSALKNMIKPYPQVIRHHIGMDGVSSFSQIVYIAVTCMINSNLSELYHQIGQEIDKALGLEKIYSEYINKQRTLGAKVDALCDLINCFGIGAIIIDEIQLLNFSANRESSFESFLTINNRTKAAICIIGTPDAYERMFVNNRTARRIGEVIDASNYCYSKEFYIYFFRTISHYQWFDERIIFDDTIINAIWECTHGVADMVTGLYIGLHEEYLSLDKPPTIDASFVKRVARKIFSQRRKEAVAAMFERDKANEFNKAITKLNNKEAVSRITHSDEQQKEVTKMIVSDKDALEREELICKIISQIKESRPDIAEEKIRKSCGEIIGDLPLSDLNQSKVLLDVFAAVTKKKTYKKKKSSESAEELFSKLEECII